MIILTSLTNWLMMRLVNSITVHNFVSASSGGCGFADSAVFLFSSRFGGKERSFNRRRLATPIRYGAF